MQGVNGLAHYIASAVSARKTESSTYQGQVKGSYVIVNGQLYPYTATIDTLISDGDYVWVMLNENKTLAVVIGK